MRSLPQRGPARRSGPRFLLLLLALAMSLSGCSHDLARPPAPAGESAGAESAEPADAAASVDATSSAVYPKTISLAEGRLPALTSRTFELPPGANVTDWTERVAAYALNGTGTWHAIFGLLDLSTGRSRIVLRRGVNEARGFSILSPRISEGWMAWEELTPKEDARPNKAEWFLYAAPIDPTALSLGKPVLVDHAVTNYQERPHYVVVGSRVFWSANLKAGPGQEGFPRSASIRVLDLAKGAPGKAGPRIMLRTNTSFPTLCATDGVLSITEEYETASDATLKVRALLVDPDSGKVLFRRDLNNELHVSHFVRASNDWVAWAVSADAGRDWPDLYFADRNGSEAARSSETTADADAEATSCSVRMAGIESIDPAFFDRYMAFESVQTAIVGSALPARVVRRIWVADLEHSTRAVLLETVDGVEPGWWQTCASAQRTHSLLLWNDLGPWIEDQARAKTLVRVYRPS